MAYQLLLGYQLHDYPLAIASAVAINSAGSHRDFSDDYFFVNKFDHAAALGSGIHTRYFDFVIRYSQSLNSNALDSGTYYYSLMEP